MVRGLWPLVKVTHIFRGKDGKVRMAQMQLGYELLMRPMTRLCISKQSSMAAGE